MNNFVEQIFYHYILTDLELTSKVKPEFFNAKNLQLLFKIAQAHTLKYKVAPSLAQIKDLIKLENKEELISEDVIDVIYSSKNKLNEYSDEWLETSTTNWAKWQNFTISVRNLVAYIKSVEVTEDNVTEIMERAKSVFNSSSILEIDETPGADFFNAACHVQTALDRTTTGYDYIDLCLKGGSWNGSLITFLAPPKAGKSLWLQNLCAKSVINGDDCAYISLELPEPMVMARIGSNLLNIPALEYDKYSNDTAFMKNKLTAFQNSSIKPRGQLWIKSFPPSSMTSNDFEACILKEEERRSTPEKPFKFKKVYLDYLNIMKNWRNPNSENTYMKIKQLAEDVKAVAVNHDWAVITATQTRREAFDASDITVSDVSESVGLNATVDALFAIIADPMMRAQSRYKLKCLLDRVAPMNDTYKMYSIDQTYLRIDELLNDTWHDCEVVYNNVNKIVNNPGTSFNNPPQNNKNENTPNLNVTNPGELINIPGQNLF